MKVTHYQQMMAYLTRPGYDKGGKVLPKKKPQEEIKRRSRINYEKLKKYLDPESQMFIEKELGFAIGGSVETPKRGLVDEPGSYGGKDSYVISDDLKKLIKEKIKLKPGQKWNFYNPDTGKGHTFGVPKGTPLYDKARYYGGKQAKDLARSKEKYAQFTDKDRKRIRKKVKKFLKENPEKAEARKIQQQEYRARSEIKKRDALTRAAYEATPERKEMKKTYITNRLAKIGLWPPGNNFKENVWRDLYRSSQVQNPRWVIADEQKNPLTNDQYPKRNGKTFWGEGKYKKVKFLDTETGQLIKLDNSIKGKGISMEKYLNSNFGKGTYDNALNSYRSKDAMKNYEIEIGGKKQKLGTVLRNRIIAPDKIDQLFGSSVFHVSHDEGVGKNWWKSRVTTGDANFKLKDLDRVLQRDLKIAKTESEKNKAIKAYEKKVRKLPGGIVTTIEQGTFGIEPTEKSVIEALSKKARITTAKGYKNLLDSLNNNVVKAVEELPSKTKGEICNAYSKGGLSGKGSISKRCADAIKKNPFKAATIVAEKTRTLPDSASVRAFNAATKLVKDLPQILARAGRLGLGAATFGASELALEGAFQIPGFQRGESIEDLKDKSILGLYGIGQDNERKKLEREVAVTGQTGALEYYDYLKDTARINEIDAILNTSGPDEDVSDLLVEKEELQKNLITPTEEQAEQFQNMNLRMVGQVAARRKARGFSPTDLIEEGPSAQDFMTVNKPLSLELGGIFDPMIEQFEAGQVPRSQGAAQRRRLRRNPEIERLYQQSIQRANQNIMFPVEGTFAGGGIAKLAGVDSGPAPKSGPTPQGLDFLMKRGR